MCLVWKFWATVKYICITAFFHPEGDCIKYTGHNIYPGMIKSIYLFKRKTINNRHTEALKTELVLPSLIKSSIQLIHKKYMEPLLWVQPCFTKHSLVVFASLKIYLFLLFFGCSGSLLLHVGSHYSEQGLLFVAVHGFVISVASLAVKHRL